MKFVCLGYYDEKAWQALSEDEQKAILTDCAAFVAQLRNEGHLVGGEALQGPDQTSTLRLRAGNLIVTDGPYAETKEQLAGFGLLEARDRDHAIQLMSRHPGLRMGPFELRPVEITPPEDPS
jgi:hypothetical protein